MDDILTLQELHAFLKIPKPTLYQLAQTGRIPAAKVGRHWRFRRCAIEHWLQDQELNGRHAPLHAPAPEAILSVA